MRKRFLPLYGHPSSLSIDKTSWREFSIIIGPWRDGGTLRGKRFLSRWRMASWTRLFREQKNSLRFTVTGKRGAFDARRRTLEDTRCQASRIATDSLRSTVWGSRPCVRYLPIFSAYPNNRVERTARCLRAGQGARRPTCSKRHVNDERRRDTTQPPADRRVGASRGRLRRCSSSTYQVDTPSSLRLASDPSTLPTRPARLFGSALIQRQKLSQSPKRTKLSR